MQISRDSLLWWITMIGSVATAITGHYDKLPLFLQPYHEQIELAALLSGIVAGKLASSPLPGKNELPL